MIVDLASSGFEHLRLYISLEADYDEVRRSGDSAGLTAGHRSKDDFHYLERAGFRKDGRHHRVEAHLSASAKDSSSMTLVYTLGEVPKLRTRRANLKKIGLVLDDLAVSCSVVCSASGDFSPDRFKPIVGLPLLRFNMPHGFFDELRGVRLVKLTDGVESDSVALDIHEEGELHVDAQTDYATTLSSNVPSDALARLVKLRDHAVTEV